MPGCCWSRAACSGSRRCLLRKLSAADILGPSLLAAVGLGFSFVPVTIAAVDGSRASERQVWRQGLINTTQQVGGALGLAILATIANSRTQGLFHTGVHTTRRSR